MLYLIIQYDFTDDDSSWSLPLSGKIILIDPGHGGVDGGADAKNVQEKDVALNISLKIRSFLEQQGALVIMTRDEDFDLADKDTRGLSRRKVEDLKQRLKMINESDADFFVSIHLNSIPSPKWSGAQTFYGSKVKESKQAAKLIQSELVRNLENTDREAKPLNKVYILKHAKKPGALVEVGFLSNPTERKDLQNEVYQEKVAASISHGINSFYVNMKDQSKKKKKES